MEKTWAVARVKRYSQPFIIRRYENFLKYYIGEIKDFYYNYVEENNKKIIVMSNMLFLKPGSNFDFITFLKLEPYVYYFYKNGSNFLAVSEKEIKTLRKKINEYTQIKQERCFDIGDKVIITDGFFKSYVGIVFEKRQRKTVILVDFHNMFEVKLELPNNILRRYN